MSAADVAVGMMDGAYFTSRNELLTFFNTQFNLNLTKIEQTASGAVACQLTEYLFPGSIPMSKVDWGAKSSHEYVANYKLLQKAFTKNNVQRYVDVDKLIRGKYQDNLEFCQWLKAFWDMQNGGDVADRDDYDPVAVRAKGKGGKVVATNIRGGARSAPPPPVRSSSSVSSSAGRSGGNNAPPVVGKARIGSSASSSATTSSSSSSSSSSARPAPSRSPRRVTTSTARSVVPRSSAPTQKENTGATNHLATTTTSRKPATIPTSSSSSSSAEIKQYQDEITQLKSQQNNLQTKYSELQVLSTELEMNIVAIESERDFYFEKLRGIEVMLQVYKEKEESNGEVLGIGDSSSTGEMKMLIDKIFKVMYAAMEDNVGVDDEGNLIGDVALDDSVLQSNVSLESIRPQAQDELINDGGDEELLTSGIVEPVAVNIAAQVVDQVNLAQLSDDDDDDDELLTAGIVSPVNDVLRTSDINDVAVENVNVSVNQQFAPPESDDEDVELLTSGIDSGDEEAAADDEATNRSAENARIISQLVGDDDDDDISEEDLLADEASQDEY